MAMSKLEAELYALTHRGNPADAEFYANASCKASRILELGSGYGRLIPTLVPPSRGSALTRQLWGIEREPWLLAAAERGVQRLKPEQRKRVTLVSGDIRDFTLGVTFDCILLPYNGLYCLLNRGDLVRCLDCVRQHLAPGGEFIFDVWAADRFHANGASRAYRDDPGPILSIVHQSQVWDVYEKSRLRSRYQRLDVVYTYVSRERGTCVTIPVPQRYAPSAELRSVLASTGFRITCIFGNFERGRFRRNSDQLIVRARAVT